MKNLIVASIALAAAGLANAESITYAADPTHTSVMFEVRHFGTATVRGRFDKKEGSVTLDAAAKTGKANFTFDINSVSTGVPPLDTHLKSKDFFNAAEAPTATFVGDKFSFDGAKVTAVSGLLTLAGKTGPVTLNATNFNCYDSPMLKRQVCGGSFETTIKRSLWGVNYGLAFGLPDDVHLLIEVEAVKQ